MKAGQPLYFASIAFNATLWTFLAAAFNATFVYGDDPESMEGWGLIWFFSIPMVFLGSLVGTLTYSTYRSAKSALARTILYVLVVLFAGLFSPFGGAVIQRLLHGMHG